jgi:glycosyltransferase involved in cell wall biosynthesis
MPRVLLLSNLFPSAAEPTRGVFNLSRFGALARHCPARVLSPVPWWSRAHRRNEWFSAPSDDRFGLQAWYPTYWSVPRFPQFHATGMAHSLRPHLTRIARDFPFDVILGAWAYPDGAAAARLADEFSCPFVLIVQGSDLNELPRNPALRKQIRTALGRAQRVVAVSRALGERAAELGVAPERIVVQHNGVDGERFCLRDRSQSRERLGLAPDRRWIACVGNFKEEKGVAVLVEAMGRLDRDADGDISLALVGSGPLESELRARAEALGVASRVHFIGRRPHAEVPDWISACDVLCLPSFREGCPNVVLEALASGRPVVASRVGGVPELLDRENGLMVAAGEPSELAEALREALSRTWSAERLRETVPFLSWEQYGITLAGAVQAACREYVTPARAAAVPRVVRTAILLLPASVGRSSANKLNAAPPSFRATELPHGTASRFCRPAGA